MEDNLFCIIIFITPSAYVVPPIRDVIDVIGHAKSWGKTSVVSQVSSTHTSVIEMYFWVFQGNLDLETRRIHPSWVIIPLNWSI